MTDRTILPDQRSSASISGKGFRLTPEQRSAVITSARTWLRTPYHHQGAIKGVGADCAMFPIMVFQECGILPAGYRAPDYSMQWHLHRSDELYLQEVEKFCREIPAEPGVVPALLPADYIIFHFGRTYSHGAIVLDWPLCIHSYIPHGVTLMDASRDGEVIGRKLKYFEVDLEKIAQWA